MDCIREATQVSTDERLLAPFHHDCDIDLEQAKNLSYLLLTNKEAPLVPTVIERESLGTRLAQLNEMFCC